MNPKEKLESLQRDIKARAGRLRTEVEVKQGELKDQSFKVVLELSESALNTVAEVVDKIPVAKAPHAHDEREPRNGNIDQRHS